jgi:hypothetical protein
MGIVEKIDIKMGGVTVRPSVREAFLAAIAQESKIDLQSQQEGSFFLQVSAITIHIMRPSILTRPSSRGATELVRQSTRKNDSFGMVVLPCLYVEYRLGIRRSSFRLCCICKWKSPPCKSIYVKV